MGGLKKSSNAIYLSIVEGKLARRFKAPTPETETRVTSENTTVYEEYFKSIEGRISGIDVKSHEKYGASLLVYMKYEGTTYCIQMQMNSRYAFNFLKTLLNVNLSQDVELSPSEKKLTDGKFDQTVFLKQNNVAIKRYYVKDDGKGLPEPKKKYDKIEKKDKWDWKEVIDFLYDNVIEPVRESLQNLGHAQPVQSNSVSSVQDELTDVEYLDSIIENNSDLNS